MDDRTQDNIETRLYFIIFLLINGYKNCNLKGIWVMGKVMNMLITPKNKSNKYDKTVKDLPGYAEQ